MMIAPFPAHGMHALMKGLIVLLLLVMPASLVEAQNYMTRTAHINIKSTNKVQNIVADNYQAACLFNARTGQFKLIALIKSFEYRIGAMNRVMNTRNIDVTEFPRIAYDGNIVDLKQIHFSKPGSHAFKVNGMLYIWDEKRVTHAGGVITVLKDGSIRLNSDFTIVLEEVYLKKIDRLMRQKLPSLLSIGPNTLGISKNIQVRAEAILRKQ